MKKIRMVIDTNKKMLTIAVHCAVWLCFFIIPFIFYPHPQSNYPTIFIAHLRVVLVASTLYLIGFYYLNTQILIPKYLLDKKWFLYLGAVGVFFIIFKLLPETIASFLTQPITEADYKIIQFERFKHQVTDTVPEVHLGLNFLTRRRHLHFFPNSYLIFILVFGIGTCMSVIQQWLSTEEKKKEIEREKLNTELLFLRSQINPHFFFNTLNNIYSLSVSGSVETAPAILKLSSIMRYVISDAQDSLVSLDREIIFINNFIHLQLVRLTDKVTVNFNTEGNTENMMIAPLLFIPFVENAFKYGISTKESTTISFHLRTENNKVLFSASNKIVQTENNMRETTGIGINNVKRRLVLLYPDKHKLHILNTEQTFSIQLEILLA